MPDISSALSNARCVKIILARTCGTDYAGTTTARTSDTSERKPFHHTRRVPQRAAELPVLQISNKGFGLAGMCSLQAKTGRQVLPLPHGDFLERLWRRNERLI